MTVFVGYMCASLAMGSLVILGFDRDFALTKIMPRDSYVTDFSNALQKFRVEYPVYYVVKNTPDYGNVDVQNRLCGGAGCKNDSLLGK